MWSIVNYVIILRGVVGKWAWSKAEGGGGGLTWPLVLRIFGMVSITFFFAPPSVSPEKKKYFFSGLTLIKKIGPGDEARTPPDPYSHPQTRPGQGLYSPGARASSRRPCSRARIQSITNMTDMHI